MILAGAERNGQECGPKINNQRSEGPNRKVGFLDFWVQGCSDSFTHQAFNVLARNDEQVHVRLHGAQADETFGKEFARLQLEFLRAQFRHALQNVLALADVRSFIGPDEVGNVNQQRIVLLACSINQTVDGFATVSYFREGKINE